MFPIRYRIKKRLPFDVLQEEFLSKRLQHSWSPATNNIICVNTFHNSNVNDNSKNIKSLHNEFTSRYRTTE